MPSKKTKILKIAGLEAQIKTLKDEQELQSQKALEQIEDNNNSENNEAIRILKAKAFIIQKILDKQQDENAGDQAK